VATKVYETTCGVGIGEVGRGRVQSRLVVVTCKCTVGDKVFHTQVKRVKLYGAGVIHSDRRKEDFG
jgi:hypothetical protein